MLTIFLWPTNKHLSFYTGEQIFCQSETSDKKNMTLTWILVFVTTIYEDILYLQNIFDLSRLLAWRQGDNSIRSRLYGPEDSMGNTSQQQAIVISIYLLPRVWSIFVKFKTDTLQELKLQGIRIPDGVVFSRCFAINQSVFEKLLKC